ncbi:glycosyltransferase family 2 protein [Heyndrickxia coagulans]|jgi:putative colanic acid biosynthesis glycosyltransferase|uniref:glycosyltransferase family 2 protein n=1 Tax=Heyndrickxia TaxID=2837504 RepID=UPI00069BB63E|nr:glycosyltransferase family 2 protein [Heyndrickxia coagulans]UXC22889.1 glycosyltransferase [Heyndrickxia coagulans]
MLISIISVCYRARIELEETIKSVLKQTYYNIELIIVDGESNDGTLEMINKYLLEFKKKGIEVRIISEPDSGIYDAMNKGIQIASGEWCIFMNAGDTFYGNDALTIMSKYCTNNYDIIYGDAAHCYNNKIKIIKAKKSAELTFINGMEFCHQATLIKTANLKKRGYDITYKIAGDYDFFVNAYRNFANFYHVPCTVAVFQKDGISSTYAGLVKLENAKVKYKYSLINKKQFFLELIKARTFLFIRNILPKKIIMTRHAMIMKRSTKNWELYNYKN